MYGHLVTKVRLKSIQGVRSGHAAATSRLPDPGRPAPERDRNGEYADGVSCPPRRDSRPATRSAGRPSGGPCRTWRRKGSSTGWRRGTYPVDEKDRYVNDFGSVEELMALSLDTDRQVVSPLQRRVDVETASRPRLGSDEIFTFTLVRLHAGVPFGYTSVFLPLRIGSCDRVRRAVRGGPAQPGDGDRADRRADERGHRRCGAERQRRRRSRVRRPAPGLRHRWLLPRIDRLYFDAEDTPIELAVSYSTPSTTPTGSSFGAGSCRATASCTVRRHRFPACPVSPTRPPRTPEPRSCPRP